MYTTRPFYGYVNKTMLMICDCLDIQKIPAFAINVVRGIFRMVVLSQCVSHLQPQDIVGNHVFKT